MADIMNSQQSSSGVRNIRYSRASVIFCCLFALSFALPERSKSPLTPAR